MPASAWAQAPCPGLAARHPARDAASAEENGEASRGGQPLPSVPGDAPAPLSRPPPQPDRPGGGRSPQAAQAGTARPSPAAVCVSAPGNVPTGAWREPLRPGAAPRAAAAADQPTSGAAHPELLPDLSSPAPASRDVAAPPVRRRRRHCPSAVTAAAMRARSFRWGKIAILGLPERGPVSVPGVAAADSSERLVEAGSSGFSVPQSGGQGSEGSGGRPLVEDQRNLRLNPSLRDSGPCVPGGRAPRILSPKLPSPHRSNRYLSLSGTPVTAASTAPAKAP